MPFLSSAFISATPFPLSPLQPHPAHCSPRLPQPLPPACRRPSPARMVTSADPLGLPPTLRNYVDALSASPTPQLRYKQLLYLATQLPSLPAPLKTEHTRVRGCTSVVHVHVALDEEGRVVVQGDSDAQLTKGLLALLVKGLTGVAPEQVGGVQGKFIQDAGLGGSLTPSRNNGFLNMLEKIKESVRDLQKGEGGGVEKNVQDADDARDDLKEEVAGRPVYSAIVHKLQALKPVSLEVTDDSAQHAGHAGAKGLNGESHFSVHVVAEAFTPLSLVQRHRLIYTLLAHEMGEGGVHALAIDAKTPAEAGM